MPQLPGKFPFPPAASWGILSQGNAALEEIFSQPKEIFSWDFLEFSGISGFFFSAAPADHLSQILAAFDDSLSILKNSFLILKKIFPHSCSVPWEALLVFP